MTIADKLLELNDVKQDIKTAIEDKGVSMTGVPFTGYPAKIDSITTGTGTGMSYRDYAKNLYSMWGFGDLFTEAWTESQDSLEVLFEIPVTLAAANQDFGAALGGEPGEMVLDLYVGTDSTLTDLYNFLVGGGFGGVTYPNSSAVIINKSVVSFQGDMSLVLGIPFPVYSFGNLGDSPASIDQFILADLTPLGMGLGVALGKTPGVVIPDNSITVRRGFENYEAGLIIPEMIEIVGDDAFNRFSRIDGDDLPLPYIIGHNVKYIGEYGFGNLSEHNLPLNIPDSVEWIGELSFAYNYTKNKTIVIPRNVTYIGSYAFSGYGTSPTVIMYPEIPPIINFDSNDTGPFPNDTTIIYVPDDAVNAYKSAWTEYIDKIAAISSRFE